METSRRPPVNLPCLPSTENPYNQRNLWLFLSLRPARPSRDEADTRTLYRERQEGCHQVRTQLTTLKSPPSPNREGKHNDKVFVGLPADTFFRDTCRNLLLLSRGKAQEVRKNTDGGTPPSTRASTYKSPEGTRDHRRGRKPPVQEHQQN